MARDSIPILNLEEYTHGSEESKAEFIGKLGNALEDIGFFALAGHGIPLEEINNSYTVSKDFFELPENEKENFEMKEINRQRGFVPFGVEHAKSNPAPDLKEFWQTGRTLDENHPLSNTYPENVWPDEIMPSFRVAIDNLYVKMEKLSRVLLEICSLYLGKSGNWLPDMAKDGNTILRVIHYPALGENVEGEAVRSAAHEDINFITLLVGATADGLEVMDHDGEWIKVEGNHEHLIVDSGDMLQNITNGLFKAVTHRVVNPPDQISDRYSMPLFTHPRDEIDLTPLPEFVEKTGGVTKYPAITAGEYLYQRLKEIGLAD